MWSASAGAKPFGGVLAGTLVASFVLSMVAAEGALPLATGVPIMRISIRGHSDYDEFWHTKIRYNQHRATDES